MTEKYKTYSNYKESGVEWLGEMPSHWEAKRLGHFFEERREKVSDKEYSALSVTKNGIVPQLETAAKTNDSDNRKKVLKNDFVINSRSDRKGSSGISKYDGSVSLIAIVLAPRNIEPPFAHHLLRSRSFQEEFYRYGKGIVADLWSTNSSEMKNIIIPKIPSKEQQKIAGFLDYETGKIDGLIAKQKRLMALLHEKRQAVISHAVTKGLNPNTPMRPSNIEWLGDIPAHWEMKKLKYVGAARNGLTYSPEDIVEPSEGILVLRSSNVQNAKLAFDDNVYVRKDIREALITKENDILICSRNGSRALIGKNALIDKMSAGLSYGAFMMLYRSKINQYLFWVFNSMLFKYQSGTFLTSTINQLTVGNIDSFEIPIPPDSERNKIIQYVKQKTKIIDNLISKSQSAITLMQERRTALISAAVTGKIDVRDWVAPEHSQTIQKDVA